MKECMVVASIVQSGFFDTIHEVNIPSSHEGDGKTQRARERIEATEGYDIQVNFGQGDDIRGVKDGRTVSLEAKGDDDATNTSYIMGPRLVYDAVELDDSFRSEMTIIAYPSTYRTELKNQYVSRTLGEIPSDMRCELEVPDVDKTGKRVRRTVNPELEKYIKHGETAHRQSMETLLRSPSGDVYMMFVDSEPNTELVEWQRFFGLKHS